MKCLCPVRLTKGDKVMYDVPCGTCLACRINRTTEWTTRIMHEGRLHRDNIFLTLTYNPEHLPKHGSLEKRDVQLFFKRLRKNSDFRYFGCGEYGEGYQRPHYHLILFGISNSPEQKQLIEQAWGKGFIYIGTLTEQSARYCAQYVQKQLLADYDPTYEERKIAKEFLMCSRRPGIASEFAARYMKQWSSNGYLIVNGKKRTIPRYYWSKLDEEEVKKIKEKNRWLRWLGIYDKAQIEGKTVAQVILGEDPRGIEASIKGRMKLKSNRKL